MKYVKEQGYLSGKCQGVVRDIHLPDLADTLDECHIAPTLSILFICMNADYFLWIKLLNKGLTRFIRIVLY